MVNKLLHFTNQPIKRLKIVQVADSLNDVILSTPPLIPTRSLSLY